MPSTSSFADQFSISRRDSETTVASGTSVSGTVSDARSKRFSVSTIATTLTNAASSETLHGQFKRFRPDSRSNSYRSGSLPSVRSPRSIPLPDAEEGRPPVRATPRQSPHQVSAEHSAMSLPPMNVIEAGTLAQRRRVRSSAIITEAINQDEPRIRLPAEAGDDILSVINEHASDAGSMLATPRPSTDRRPESHELFLGNMGSRKSSEGPSIFTRETSPLESSISATSLRDLLEHDGLSQDSSDADDTMSDVTDHTDISLIEAFEAWHTKFDPALLSLAMSLKEQVVERIKQRLQTMMIQAHGSQHRPTQPNSSSSSPYERSAASADKPGSLGALPILRKRPSDEDDDGTSGGGNGDDKDRRKRQNISARATLEARLRKFSCPFHKMYPDSGKLYKSCKAPGWSSVHRVK
jgi:hypothetical protein